MSKITGYKIIYNNHTRLLATIEIPEDAMHNINRLDIINKNKATYKCNKAKVVNIEYTRDIDKSNIKPTIGYSICFPEENYLTYTLNKVTICTDYSSDASDIHGIHFFIDKLLPSSIKLQTFVLKNMALKMKQLL